jgi:hypothetical protein
MLTKVTTRTKGDQIFRGIIFRVVITVMNAQLIPLAIAPIQTQNIGHFLGVTVTATLLARPIDRLFFSQRDHLPIWGITGISHDSLP